MQNQPVPEPTDELKEIYHQLKLGMGREHVNDNNVQILIDMAARNGDAQLEQILREWQADCGPGGDMPSAIPPTSGFNKENVKRR